MATDITRSFADQIGEMEDIPASGVLEPGRMWWHHGEDGRQKTPGDFYTKATELVVAPGEPWIADARFTSEQGFATPLLHIAVIGKRDQWFFGGTGKDDPKRWLDHYREGEDGKKPKKQVDYLIFAEGIDDPMVLSVSGKYKAAPLRDILNTYRYGLLKQASLTAKRQLPPWSFWLPIACKKDANGKVVYEKAMDAAGKEYGSIATPPALFLPENPMDALFVGPELIRRGSEVFNTYREWFKSQRRQRDDTEIDAEYTVEDERLALPAAGGTGLRNVPQPIEDDSSLPF